MREFHGWFTILVIRDIILIDFADHFQVIGGLRDCRADRIMNDQVKGHFVGRV